MGRGRRRDESIYAIEYGMTPGQRPELDVAEVDRPE
jgi:hypothetical protein